MNDSRASRLALMDALPPELLERVLRLPFEDLVRRNGTTEDRYSWFGSRAQKDAALNTIERDLPGRLCDFFAAARVCKQWKAVWSIINDDDDFWLTNCRLRWPTMHTYVFSLWHHAKVSGVVAAGIPAGGNAESWCQAFKFGTVQLSGGRDLSRVMLWIEAYSANLDIILDRELRLSEMADGWDAPELADEHAPPGGYSWQEVKDWEIEWGLQHDGGRVTLSSSPRVTQTFDCRDGTEIPSTDDLEDTSDAVNAEGRWGYADIICGPDDMPFRTCQLSRSVHDFALKTVLALDFKRYKRRRKRALQAGDKYTLEAMDKFATAEEYLVKRELPELEMNAMLNFKLGSEETIIEQGVDLSPTPPEYSLEVWGDGTGGMGCGDMSTDDLKVWVGLLDFREEEED